MQSELKELLKKEKSERITIEEFIRKDSVPLQIREYIAEKCGQEKKQKPR
jgi:hypothetical protein